MRPGIVKYTPLTPDIETISLEELTEFLELPELVEIITPTFRITKAEAARRFGIRFDAEPILKPIIVEGS